MQRSGATKKTGPTASPPQRRKAGKTHPAAGLLAGSNQANQAALLQYLESRKPAPQPAVVPEPPRITPEDEAQMQQDLEFILLYVRNHDLIASSELLILERIRNWALKDEQHRRTSGYQGTDYLTKFLRMLKVKNINYGDQLADRWMSVYDILWHFMDDYGFEFQALAQHSREGTVPAAPPESGWHGFGRTMGTGMAVNSLGFLQGMSKNLAGAVDGASFLLNLGTFGLVDRTSLANEVGEGFDYMGKQWLGDDWTKGPDVLFGMNGAQLSSGLGGLAMSVALAMSGNVPGIGQAGTVTYGLTNAKGVADAYDGAYAVWDTLEKEAKAKGQDFTIADALKSGTFRMNVLNLISNTFGTIMGIPSSQIQTRTMKLIGVWMDGLSAVGYSDRLIEIARDDTMKPEEKWKAAGPIIIDLTTKVIQIGLGAKGYRDEFTSPEAKARAEAQAKAEADAQAAYEARSAENARAMDEADAREAQSAREAVAAQEAARARAQADADARARAQAEAEAAAQAKSQAEAEAAAKAEPEAPARTPAEAQPARVKTPRQDPRKVRRPLRREQNRLRAVEKEKARQLKDAARAQRRAEKQVERLAAESDNPALWITDHYLKVVGDIVENGPLPRSLDNKTTRLWYTHMEAEIPNMVDPGAPLMAQARQASAIRNIIRERAREAMADRATAEGLMKTDKNLTWKQVVQKRYSEGNRGDALWQKIIQSSQKSRQSVNERLGVTPSAPAAL